METLVFSIIIGAVIASVMLANIWRQPERTCPVCGTPLPKFRKTRSVKQALYGGWTCSFCGAEVDRQGREITA
jgi:hypothetical protein